MQTDNDVYTPLQSFNDCSGSLLVWLSIFVKLLGLDGDCSGVSSGDVSCCCIRGRGLSELGTAARVRRGQVAVAPSLL